MRAAEAMGGLIAGALEVMAEQCTARGARGVVLAAAPLAAALGAEAIRAGGNAFDGAVTAALAETVLLPPKCGLAGDLVALRSSAEDVAPEALLAIGGAPRRLAEVAAAGKLNVTGPLSVGVPGAPAGYDALAALGRLGRRRLAAPATDLAINGFAWAQICTSLALESADLVKTHNETGTVYFPDGIPLQPATLVRLPRMAALIDEWAHLGPALFWGPIGEVMADSVRKRGGVLEATDLHSVEARWEPAARGIINGLLAWATPSPTHGPSLLEATAGATPNDGPGLVWDRVMDAVSKRGHLLGDPSGTSMVSAADDEGNVVIVIHSNSFPRFGSGLVLEEFDLILNNRPGRGFASQPGHPNFPAPGKRPATTLHAWAVAGADGAPGLFGGTPGGENQMPWNAQTIGQIVSGQTDPGRLVVSPRWEWLTGGGVAIEEGFSQAEEAELIARAARVQRVPRWGLRSAQQVLVRPRAGRPVVGAVDPRTGGAGVAV
ncbi:MAG: gamma-glutamyltransferase [Actinomycetota bacterium]